VNCVNESTWILGRQIGDQGLRVSVQNPIRINGGLEPQPDLAVMRARDYGDNLPVPEDVLLVIEVSDTTLRYDRNVKLPLYARAGTKEAWIIDLPNKAIEHHNDPSETGYGRMQRVGWGKTLASEVFPDLVSNTDSLIG